MSGERIVARVGRALAEGDVVEGLAKGISPTDLQSLMLHVYSERSARRTPGELLAQYERAAMLQPSAVDARALHEVERAAFRARVASLRAEARREFALPEAEEGGETERRQVDRIAIRRALEAHGNLTFTRRRIPLPIRSRKAANIT